MNDRFLRMDRQEFTDGQKLAIWERSGHRCQGCSRPMMSYEKKRFDHIKPLALGGKTEVENGQVLGECCWPDKDADDQAMISKADAAAKKHVLGRKKKRWGYRP